MNKFSKREENKLKQLHKQGLSCNEIARQMHRSSSTIGKYAKQLGLSFARAQTKNATEARCADAAQKRAILKDRLLDEAALMLDSLHKPFLLAGLGGRDNRYGEHVMPQPPPAEMRNIMTSVGIALQRSIELERVDQQSETSVTVIDEYLKTLGVN